ncbi:MAG: LysR family transcriptional regulator [Sphingobacteriales bacterium]|nr:MAG: LysR family transcriptional regulator [Sphingobacteriales bacterium]
MNIQQLQYVLAVAEHRHFQKAAAACFVTPAALSIMIKKLEAELDVVLFDRSRQPVLPTAAGLLVIHNARSVLSGIRKLEEEVKWHVSGAGVSGLLRIGIIPTLAPYLLHLFLPGLLNDYPELRVELRELTTEVIKDQLRKNHLDVGILALESGMEEFRHYHLFNERLMVFVGAREQQLNKQYLLATDIDVTRLWLLEEEHCLRSQVMNLCSLKKSAVDHAQLTFDAGSIETLMNMVEAGNGITVIPELATLNLTAKRKKQLRTFAAPIPVRAIGMITYRHYVKASLLQVLEASIKKVISKSLAGGV